MGGPGATQATGALDQALQPQGMLAGLRALREGGEIVNVSLGMNAHTAHVRHAGGTWTHEVITDFIEAAPVSDVTSVGSIRARCERAAG